MAGFLLHKANIMILGGWVNRQKGDNGARDSDSAWQG